MPQTSNTRPNQGVGQEQTPGRVGLAVAASQDVQAPRRDVSGLQRAAGGFVDMLNTKQQKEAEELSKMAETLGYNDAAAGKVDEARLSNDPYYQKGAKTYDSITAGNKWIAQKNVELKEALKDSKGDLDFEAWRREKLDEYLSGREPASDLEKEFQNRFIAQFDQNTRFHYEAASAQLKLENTTRMFGEAFGSALDLKQLSVEEAKAAFASYRDVGGLDDDEAKAEARNVLLLRLGKMNDTNAYTLAEGLGLLDDPKAKADFTQQLELANRQAEAQRLQAMRQDTERNARVIQTWGRMAHEGRITVAALKEAEARGELLPEESERLLSMQMSVTMQRVEQAKREAAKEAQGLLIAQAIAMGGPALEVAIARGDVKEKDVKDHLNKSWANAVIAGDPDQLENVLSDAQRAQRFPDGLKNVLDSVDLRNTEQSVRTLELFRTLKNGRFGDFMMRSMSTQSYQRLERLSELVELNGMPPQKAVESMAKAAVPWEEAAPKVRANKAVNDAYLEVQKDLGLEGTSMRLREAFETMVTTRVSDGGMMVEEAAAKAKDELTKRFAVVDNAFLNRNWMYTSNGIDLGDVLPDAWDKYRSEYLIPMMKERLGDSAPENIALLPDPTKPGKFYLYDPALGMRYSVTDANGNNIDMSVTTDQIYSKWAELGRPKMVPGQLDHTPLFQSSTWDKERFRRKE